jgi:hypothetical protein
MKYNAFQMAANEHSHFSQIQHRVASHLNDCCLLKLIVDSISEGAQFSVSMLIVWCSYFKLSFHFCEDCRIFCEGEWDMAFGPAFGHNMASPQDFGHNMASL